MTGRGRGTVRSLFFFMLKVERRTTWIKVREKVGWETWKMHFNFSFFFRKIYSTSSHNLTGALLCVNSHICKFHVANKTSSRRRSSNEIRVWGFSQEKLELNSPHFSINFNFAFIGHTMWSKKYWERSSLGREWQKICELHAVGVWEWPKPLVMESKWRPLKLNKNLIRVV